MEFYGQDDQQDIQEEPAAGGLEKSEYAFERLGNEHKQLKKYFVCGAKDLEDYLKRWARQEADHGLGVTHLLLDLTAGRIVGYHTMSSVSIKLPPGYEKRLPKRYPAYPATLIGRLAVDDDYRGQGHGHDLVYDAFRRALGVSEQLGSLAIVADARDEAARGFWERYELEILHPKGEQSYPMRMFINMSTVQAAFG